jgi:predicted XRE-type DNA-binding protein
MARRIDQPPQHFGQTSPVFDGVKAHGRNPALQRFGEGIETMKREQFASVWDAIEATPAEVENMKLRASLMLALQDRIRASAMTQAQAAKLFGVTQPRVSDLMRGKINLFAIDTLVSMLASAGLHVEMHIAEAAWPSLCDEFSVVPVVN